MAFVTGGEPGIYNILFLNGAYSVADVNGSLTFGGTFTATQAIGSLPGPAGSRTGLVGHRRRRIKLPGCVLKPSAASDERCDESADDL